MKTVLFDMDGTLHYMDPDGFTREYFNKLSAYFAPRGISPDKLLEGVMKGTFAMMANRGGSTNKDVFWQAFAAVMGQEVLSYIDFFEEFYRDEFNSLSSTCHPYEGANELIKALKGKGYKVVLATNPVFPLIAHLNRLKWAGLDADDFDYITSYENSYHCKPNPDYFREIMSVTGSRPDECIMVGNDVTEDMAAQQAGMQVYLVTDCIVNSKNADMSPYPQGNFKEMCDYVLKF